MQNRKLCHEMKYAREECKIKCDMQEIEIKFHLLIKINFDNICIGQIGLQIVKRKLYCT